MDTNKIFAMDFKGALKDYSVQSCKKYIKVLFKDNAIYH